MTSLILCLLAASILLQLGCRDEEKGRQWAEGLRPLSIVVQNGEAAVLNAQDGFVLVLPNKTDVFAGQIDIYVSSINEPTNWLLTESVTMSSENSSITFRLLGSLFSVGGGSKDSVNLSLDFLDQNTGIFKIDAQSMNEINPADLEFQTSQNDIDQVLDGMLDDLSRRKK